MRCHGFLPFFDENSRILVLGSFPSVKSRKTDFYYGNDRNRFWAVLSDTFCASLPRDNDEKKSLLRNTGIALWDIVAECDIVGSADSSIKNVIVADLDAFLVDNPGITKIIANGKTSYRLLSEHFPQYLNITVCLPSTSPANPRFSPEQWREALLQ